MKKKIVVITGSPRKNGNSFTMVEAFIKAAEKRGHSIVRYNAADMNIKGCTACKTCYKTGKACSFDDDFNEVANSIEEADGIVFATPLYWYTFPAKIKLVIDKFYSFLIGNKAIGKKKTALIVCCEEKTASALDGIRFSYNQTIDLLQWKSIGEILVPGVDEIGDIQKTNGVEQAIALVAKF